MLFLKFGLNLTPRNYQEILITSNREQMSPAYEGYLVRNVILEPK